MPKPKSPHTEFYQINPKKFYWLSVATFNLYEIYWFYKNWQAVQAAEQSKIKPVWRAVFAIFFVRQLFRKMADSRGLEQFGRFSADRLSSMYFAVFFLGLALNRLPDHPLTYLATVILVLVSPLPQTYVQRYINTSDKAATLSGKEKALAAVCAILWLLFIIGAALPAEA